MLPSIFGENLFDDMWDDMFDTTSMFGRHNPLYGKHSKNLMKTDVRETDHSYELDVDLPGFKKDEIQINLENGYLTISAAKGLEKNEEGKKGEFIRRERYTGECSRSFYIGEDVNENEIQARFEDGILKLSVPKKEVQQVETKKFIAIE